jgi:hypothetical protein
LARDQPHSARRQPGSSEVFAAFEAEMARVESAVTALM